MLIIEGADHLGKTTLAKATNLEYNHLGVPPDGWDFHFDYLKRIQPGTVWDRFHLGAVVYGRILGKHPVHVALHTYVALINGILRDMEDSELLVLYTSDEAWYMDHLKNNGKKEEFDISTIVMANRIFPWVAPSWALTYDIRDGNFPTAEDIAWIAKS